MAVFVGGLGMAHCHLRLPPFAMVLEKSCSPVGGGLHRTGHTSNLQSLLLFVVVCFPFNPLVSAPRHPTPQPIELNASDVRSRKLLEAQIGPLTRNCTMTQFYGTASKPRASKVVGVKTLMA